ncbi:MAG: hypothetical protein N3H31_01135 [Candidatus Nezhaarchaeota archaeon]|nr:hypothetical protein [Candidatus Nezhaarchaeota archaeon]
MEEKLSKLDDVRASLARVEDLLERIRMEFHRDIAERVFYLESEVLNLRRELRRMSDVIDLLFSRFQEGLASFVTKRDSGETFLPKPLSAGPEVQATIARPEEMKPRQKGIRVKKAKEREVTTKGVKLTKEEVLKYLSAEANDTELRILKLLYENPEYGKKGSTEMAKAIGKVREHTARTLKRLCELGLLVRQEDKVPYSYYVPKEVAEAIRFHFR